MLTIKEVATVLRAHTGSVLRWIKDGKLKASKIGRNYLVSKNDLEVFISSNKNESRGA